MSSANVAIESTATENPSNQFSLDQVKSCPNKIAMTDYDTTNNLSMYCYTKCTNDSENIVKDCRGVVFQGDKVVMRAFGYTQEFSETDVANISQTLEPIFDKCRFFVSEEGSLIRMFAITLPDGTVKWYTTTHRKFDSFRSKWASRESFGSAFVKALEEEVKYNAELAQLVSTGDGTLLEKFQRNCLDPQSQYMFLVRNSKENRIVCKPSSTPRTFHVGTFKNGELNFDPISVPMPKEYKFASVADLLEHVHKMNYEHYQGIIVFAPNNKQYKVFQEDYHYFTTIRGNEPSIKYRYLQLRNHPKQVKDLLYLYPDSKNVFNMYEDYLQRVLQNIYDAYVCRFIKKQFVSMPAEEFSAMKEVHAWHELDRAKNRVSFQLVSEILNSQTPTSLNRMIHRLIEEDRERELTPQNQSILPSPTEHDSQRGGRGRGDRGDRGNGRGSRGADRGNGRGADRGNGRGFRGNARGDRGGYTRERVVPAQV